MPVRGQSTREAKETCRLCPVRLACLDYALGLSEERPFRREVHGIWGGLSEGERRDLRATPEHKKRVDLFREAMLESENEQ